MPNAPKKYGVYTMQGKKLKNSDALISRMWPPITEKVLDSTVNDFFGILKHYIYIDGKKHWIIRESQKQYLDVAIDWFGREKKDVV